MQPEIASQLNVYGIHAVTSKRIKSDNIDCVALNLLTRAGARVTVNLFLESEDELDALIDGIVRLRTVT